MEETTWIETIDLGWNTLAGIDAKKIKKKCKEYINKNINEFGERPMIYGKEGAAMRFVKSMNWI